VPRGIRHTNIPHVLAQPGKRFAVVVVQDADEMVHGCDLYMHTTVNLYSILVGRKGGGFFGVGRRVFLGLWGAVAWSFWIACGLRSARAS
jgi:hypothetical protein